MNKVEGLRKAGIAVTGMGFIALKQMEFKNACLVAMIAIVGVAAQWSLSMYRTKKGVVKTEEPK